MTYRSDGKGDILMISPIGGLPRRQCDLGGGLVNILTFRYLRGIPSLCQRATPRVVVMGLLLDRTITTRSWKCVLILKGRV